MLFGATAVVIMGEIFPAIGWVYEYAWFVGLFLGFVGQLLAMKLIKARHGKLPAEFEPSP